MDRRSFLQSLGLVGVTAGATYWLSHPRPQPLPPRGIYVQMGTSITAGLHGPGANLTPITVGARLNLTPINVGFDGACAGHNSNMDEFSLCWLVDALISGDWSAQDKAAAALDPVVTSTLSKFKAIDFNKVTHLGLEYGSNDFTLATPIGSRTDVTRETFRGALSYSIRRLLATYPQLHLFLITPAWFLNFQDQDSDTHPNSRGTYLREYVDAVVETAALNHIPCLDMWRTLGLGVNNYKLFTYDGTHPNEAGAIRRGEAIAAFINSVFELK